MIPKVIHYVWLSGTPFPDSTQKCLNSWNKYLPDYKIKQWNSQNFDLNSIVWLKQAFENKKYAFATDYIRFYVLYHEGGIYLDTDVEICKPLDSLLDNKFFWGYEYTGLPEAAVIGSIAGVKWLKECYKWYTNKEFNKKSNVVICPMVFRKIFEEIYPYFKLIDDGNINKIDGGSIFPYYYFSPKNGFNDRILNNELTYTIHHFQSAWISKRYSMHFRSKIHTLLISMLGKNNYNKIMYTFRKNLCKI